MKRNSILFLFLILVFPGVQLTALPLENFACRFCLLSRGSDVHFMSDPDPRLQWIQPAGVNPEVGRFQKAEIGIELPKALEEKVNAFIANGKGGLNPFDPEQIGVEAIFTNVNDTSKKYLVYGFYYENFVRDAKTIGPMNANAAPPAANWIRKPNESQCDWRIRFAPPAFGKWTVRIDIRVNNEEYPSYHNATEFTCVKSGNEGWLEQGRNHWFLRCSGSRKSFFALGQDIAWNDGSYFRGFFPFGSQGFFNLYSGGYLDVLNWTETLGDYGGNMVRIVSRPRSYNFEWEHLNNYETGMPRAWELDQLFDLCEKENMKIFFCMEFHPEFGSQSDESVWTQNPYHLEIPGVEFPDDFLTNPLAQKMYKNKLRYFMSRWGYSTSLGVFELLSEMNGWSYRNGSLQQNSEAQKKQQRWHALMLAYAESLAQYRPLLTSSSYGSYARDFDNSVYSVPQVDITCEHPYHMEREQNIKARFDAFNKPLTEKGTHALWPGKPTLFSEMGLTGTSGADVGDVEGCSDVSFHNGMWSTAFMGGFGNGFYWWQWFKDDYRVNNFPAMRAFFSGIDFESADFTDPDRWDDAPSWETDHRSSKIEVFYLRASQKEKAIGWVHNASYWYGNIVGNCPDRNGHTIFSNPAYLFGGDDAATAPTPLPEGTRFKIQHLNALTDYKVEYFYTRDQGGLYETQDLKSDLLTGTLRLKWLTKPEAADWAFKISHTATNFTASNEISFDTLDYGEDTIFAEGNYFRDTTGTMHYHWNFGNGKISDQRFDTVIYKPGTYLVTLIVTDNSGFSDMLQQYVVVRDFPKLQNNPMRFFEITNNSRRGFPVGEFLCGSRFFFLPEGIPEESVRIFV